jgi:hypothetical protein
VTKGIVFFGRVPIKDSRLNRLSFISILLSHGAKCMKLENESRKLEMKMLENEILNLVGERREETMQAYRKLLSASADEPMYLTRS